jgi:hypothetical protein
MWCFAPEKWKLTYVPLEACRVDIGCCSVNGFDAIDRLFEDACHESAFDYMA